MRAFFLFTTWLATHLKHKWKKKIVIHFILLIFSTEVWKWIWFLSPALTSIKKESICLSIHPSIQTYIYTSSFPFIYLSVFLSIHVYRPIDVYQSLYLSVFLSIYIPVCLSDRLSVFLSISLIIFNVVNSRKLIYTNI